MASTCVRILCGAQFYCGSNYNNIASRKTEVFVGASYVFAMYQKPLKSVFTESFLIIVFQRWSHKNTLECVNVDIKVHNILQAL